MGIFGKLAGGAIGFMFGGPLGAVAGAALGHGLIDKKNNNAGNALFAECPHCGEGVYVTAAGNYNCPNCGDSFRYGDSFSDEEQRQFAFFVCAISLLAKLAKADGVVSKKELNIVDHFMRDVLNLKGEMLQTARNIFNEAVNSPVSYRDFAGQLIEFFEDKPEMLRTMMSILVQLAACDNEYHDREEEMLSDIARIFGIGHSEYEKIKARFVNNQKKHYAVLGCSETDSIETIKANYRKLVHDYHPDKIASKGLPEDFMEFAANRFREIQTAYQSILEERGVRN